ncbi:hypothetical protein [Tabrizicola thermarum]|uniref:hypothetical protein n=1 Tax=Tabrizicola thermarum TaxID=2670345 RepID=UPI0012D71B41|nr:hypothetical protein [Tabrizicola thermarum]
MTYAIQPPEKDIDLRLAVETLRDAIREEHASRHRTYDRERDIYLTREGFVPLADEAVEERLTATLGYYLLTEPDPGDWFRRSLARYLASKQLSLTEPEELKQIAAYLCITEPESPISMIVWLEKCKPSISSVRSNDFAVYWAKWTVAAEERRIAGIRALAFEEEAQ